MTFNQNEGVESVPVQTSIIINYNDVYGNGGDEWYHITPIIGNIESDPEFYALSGDSAYYLSRGSPCIDAGDPASRRDPDETRADIGAIYYNQGFSLFISFSQDTLLFPTTYYGQCESLPLKIHNIGNINLILSDITFGIPPVFYCDWDPLDTLIAPRDSLEITVFFEPQAMINYTDVMTVISNVPNAYVYLLGPVFQPLIEVSDDSLFFDETNVGELDSLPLSIYNYGTVDLIIDDIVFGQPEIFYSNWDSLNNTISSNDSLELMIYFQPQESHLYTDFMTIESNTEQVRVYLWGVEVNVNIYIDLIPESSNIEIPPQGGSFNYDLEVYNPFDERLVNFWIKVTMPGGEEFPVYFKQNYILPADTLIVHSNLIQIVPASAPSGTYFYYTYLQDPLTWTYIAEDYFMFEKLPGDNSLSQYVSWDLYGFDDYRLFESPVVPCHYIISAAPNPFNPSTAINYQLQAASYTDLSVYDITGREVAKLVNGFQTAGSHSVIFDGTDFASGIYFARLQAGSFRGVQKLLLIK